MKNMLRTSKLLLLALLLSGAASQAVVPAWSLEPRELRGAYYVGGVSPRLADKALAKEMALKDAAERAAGFLESKGLGSARQLRPSVEGALLREHTLLAKPLAHSKISVEAVIQDRWVEADGTVAWTVRALICIRRKK